MKKLGVLTMCAMSLPALSQEVAKGRVVSDLKISCSYKNSRGEEKLKLSVSVKDEVHRLRSTSYTTKLKTDLFDVAGPIGTTAGLKKEAMFYPTKGQELSLKPVFWDNQITFDIKLPSKAIYPTDTEYAATFTREEMSNGTHKKTYDMKCTTKSSVETFEFPYLSKDSFNELDKENLQWRFLGEVAETSTAQLFDFLGEDESADVTAQDEEKLSKWLSNAKVLSETELKEQSAAVQAKVAKAQAALDKQIESENKALAEENNMTIEEFEKEGQSCYGEVKVVATKDGEVLGYIKSFTNANGSEEGEDDSGDDTYYNAKFEVLSNQDWSP